MRIGLMVEGQNGLTWERWAHILDLAERLEFPTLFRSDHFFIGEQRDSLEAYLSFVMAATRTSSIRFGPLVTPVTFRTPVDVGRMAAQLSGLSEGRFVMGLGAGWNEPEHRAYGISFPSTKERFDRLEDALKMMRVLWKEGEANYGGSFYSLDGANCLPRPSAFGMPLLIGGAGEKRTLLLVARYADEWNSVNLTPEVFGEKVSALERHCENEGRDPSQIEKSMMTFGIVGPNGAALDRATRHVMGMFGARRDQTSDEFRKMTQGMGMITGTTEEIVDTLGRLADLGLSEVQFQHFDFETDDVPEYLAAEVAPRVVDL
ncbi:MAG TPA: TIGR03560 family F420-dependent LLM class oxidoreductase [Dehalococcoidia bacterium]|nr:TIGR03560 family F420-dependent LLM class oxidoreductase [Dehalococcoidia bacterium]